MRRILEFEADFPDDQVDEGDEVIVPGGRIAAEVVRDALRSQGLVAGDVEQYSFHSWHFPAAGSGRPFWFLLAHLSPKYVVTVERRGWLEDLLGLSRNKFREILVTIEQAVTTLGGRSLRWFKTYDAADAGSATIEETLRA